MIPSFACTLRQRDFDIEIFLNAVLIGPDAPHGLGAENIAENQRVDCG